MKMDGKENVLKIEADLYIVLNFIIILLINVLLGGTCPQKAY